jgi:hypothetical protein
MRIRGRLWTRRYRRRPLTPLPVRFWRFVDKTPGFGPWGNCWRWKGHISKSGYGSSFTVGHAEDGKARPHVIAFMLKRGRWPKPGLDVAHKCDIRSCVRWGHLWEATRKQNIADMYRKGRQRHTPLLGSKNPRAKLTEEQVVSIRTSPLGCRRLAARHAVSTTLIKLIRARKVWIHVTK